MNSQIVANIDSELKEKAMKMAKKEGLTMKALLSFLLKWYTQEKITLTTTSSFERNYCNIEVEELSQQEEDIIAQSSKMQ